MAVAKTRWLAKQRRAVIANQQHAAKCKAIHSLGLRFLATSVFIVIFSWCCISGVSCELFTNLTWPANHTLPTGTYGCYGDNATNKMADDGDCRFVFQVSVGGSGSKVIQNSSSPWLTASFQIQQNHGQVFCQPLQCSVQATAVIYTLNVTYPVMLDTSAPGYLDRMPREGSTVHCPFVSNPPAVVTWSMNRSSHGCDVKGVNQCDLCGDEQGQHCPYSRNSTTQQCRTAVNSSCFSRKPDDSVSILYGCIGCLQCTASNTVMGKQTVQTFTFKLTAYGLCPAGVAGQQLVFGTATAKESNSLIAGEHPVHFIITYQSSVQQAVKVRSPQGHDVIIDGYNYYQPAQPILLHAVNCSFLYNFTILRPVRTEDSGDWQFEFKSAIPKLGVKTQSITVTVTEVNCSQVLDTHLQCQYGHCAVDKKGAPYCVCNKDCFGTSCNYCCPKTNGEIVTGDIIIPRPCTSQASLQLQCSKEVTQTSPGKVYWEMNHQRIHDGQLLTWTYRRGVGQFVCMSTAVENVSYAINVAIADKPVIIPPANLVIIQTGSVHQQARLTVNLSQTFNATSLQYTCSRVSGGVCGGGPRTCVREFAPENSDTAILDNVRLACCAGEYVACVTNSYGQACTTFMLDIVQDGCDVAPRLVMQAQSELCVNVMGNNDTEVSWFLNGDRSSTGFPSVRSDVNSTCCCRQYCLSDNDNAELPKGVSIVPCVLHSSGNISTCSNQNFTTASSSGLLTVAEIAYAATGGVVLLGGGAVAVLVVLKRRRSAGSGDGARQYNGKKTATEDAEAIARPQAKSSPNGTSDFEKLRLCEIDDIFEFAVKLQKHMSNFNIEKLARLIVKDVGSPIKNYVDIIENHIRNHELPGKPSITNLSGILQYYCACKKCTCEDLLRLIEEIDEGNETEARKILVKTKFSNVTNV
ncbi:uncharacterized protein LOC135822841 isoform X3 [Sycon ciliatum]|uniref:uncharacterized protein LOC135822841 isoform X3 n=1 Tax=Sycon ciliatum TaxID=27933 RepID=UPI0031F6D3DA